MRRTERGKRDRGQSENILINFPCPTRSCFPLSISNCAFFDVSLQAFMSIICLCLWLKNFAARLHCPPAPATCHIDCCHGNFPLSSLHSFHFSVSQGDRPPPLPSPLCVLSADNWRLSLCHAPCGRNQSPNAAATAARHFNGTFRFGWGRVCCWRLLPLVGATSTCIFAVAELLASCVRRTVRGTSICLNRAEN